MKKDRIPKEERESDQPKTFLELFSKSEDSVMVSTDRGESYRLLSEVPQEDRKNITDYKFSATKK